MLFMLLMKKRNQEFRIMSQLFQYVQKGIVTKLKLV